MTTESTPSPFLDFNNLTNPYRLDHGDNPSLPLVPDLLTIENYTTWSRAMCRALRAKNKLGFINGTLTKPKTVTDPLYDAWERCNDLVVSWLHNSIHPSLKSSIALVDDATQIWGELKDRFTQQNGHRIFQLKKALTGLQQDNDSVSVYFGKLKTLWDELSIYDPMPGCICGKLTILLDRYQRDCQQEMQHGMLSAVPSADTMALAVKQPYPSPKFFSKTPQQPKLEILFCTHCKIQGHVLDTCFKAGNALAPTCTHCHMTGHIAEKCYKLHGYPLGHKLHDKTKQHRFPFANMASVELEDSSDHKLTFTKEQYHQLLSLLQPKEVSIANHSVNTVKANCTHPSTMNGIISCFTSFTPTHTPWIIDTGATDHMICSTTSSHPLPLQYLL
ncbi:uncharacterized protein LOC122316352 [Carya illinoinensis]|uniref:uncharacterized protein LOC122316352 n=1 Tax=Carya illinoinensis TaxID=32201 RepID=UPI001C71910A|nr:uncharacterized protein LOC122316352 [Carya illinoinensis]